LSIAESKDRASKRKYEEVSDTKESDQNIASESKTEQKEEQKEKEEQELAERSKQEAPEEIEVSDTKESEQNIASEQKTEQKEEQEEQDLVEGSKQEEPEEINSLDTEESEQNVASEQKREQKEEQKGKQEQDLAESSKQEEPGEIEVSDTKESKQNIASEQKMEQKQKEELGEQSTQEPEENEASEHKAEDKKGDGNSELKQGPKQVLINRAPVLTLWVAVVAEREGYTFEEGLSFGKFISGLFARTKGKRIGIFDDEMESEVQKAAEKGGSKNRKKRKLDEVERFEVFGMKLPGKRLESGLRPAVQNGKPIYPNVVNAYLHRASGVDFDPVKGKKCFHSILISSTIFIDFCSNLLTMMLQKNASVADHWLRFLIV
jgi:hypothetical protein